MRRRYDSSEVFQPTTFPELTYVNRTIDGRETYEARLKKALKTKGVLSLITGASKSGKTVLCHRVISVEQIIEISGSHIRKPEDFWTQIAEKLELPIETEFSTTENNENQYSGEAGGKAGIPLLADLNLKGTLGHKRGVSESVKEKQQRSNNQMIDYMIRHQKVLVLDDFHYVPQDVQKYIARVLKNEIFHGLRAVLISLPHRSDDAIRLNADLIGRVRYINIEPWGMEELREIPKRGFELLDVEVPEDYLDLLVQESITSPQLMQQNCLNLAFVLDIDEDPTIHSVQDVQSLHDAFYDTTRDHESYDAVVRKLITGPPQGRDKRTHYVSTRGEKMDIYQLLLHALAEDPPTISIDINELRRRIANVLAPEQRLPAQLTVSNTIAHIQKILHASGEMFQILEWHEQELHILDPYFLFYLRWSKRYNQK